MRGCRARADVLAVSAYRSGVRCGEGEGTRHHIPGVGA